MIVLLDTSFLLSALKFRVDIYDEIERVIPEKHEIATLDRVTSELEGLARGKGSDPCLALELVSIKKVSIYKGKRIPCDEALLEFAREKRAIICTQDRELRKKAKAQGLRTITIRDRSYLEEE